MADKAVKVTLSADVANYVRGIGQAESVTKQFEGTADTLSGRIRANQAEASALGQQMLIAGGAIAAGLGLSAKAAMSWESSWTGVLKTVNGTPAQLEAVEAGLRDLTKILPASHTEIAAVAEAAGQLGIQTGNVVDFTRVMINLGETTNLSAETAAMSLAKFMNVMRTDQGLVSNLGSSLVALGNNFATTEADILAMAQRLSGAGVQIGLTEGDVLGLATALSSVGIEAEAGGSAMSKVMIDIAASVDQGGERLNDFAKVAGLSAEDFAAKWKTEPGAALAAFVQGLANAEEQGTSTLGILADLGITEVRMRDALLGSAAAADQFAAAMDLGNSSFEENLALAQEAELRYGTTESKLGILSNRFTEAGIVIGTHMLPALEGGAELLGKFADGLAGLDGPMGGVVAWGAVAAASLLLAGGAFLTIVPKIAETRAAMELLGLTFEGLKAKMAAGSLTALLNPMIALAMATALAAVAAGVVIYREKAAEAERQSVELEAAVKSLSSGVDDLSMAARHVADNGLIPAVNEANAERTKSQLEDLSGLMDKLAEQDKNWSLGTQFDLDTNFHTSLGAIRELGGELAKLAQTDVGNVKGKLADIREGYSLTAEQMWQFINESPELERALQQQALMAGVAVGDLSTLEQKLLLIEWATGQAASGSGEFSDGLTEQERAAKEAARAFDVLVESIRGLGDAYLSAEDAEIGFYEALDSVNEAMETNGATLDMNTKAGRDNREALASLAQSTKDYAAETLNLTGSQAAASLVLEDGRQRYIDARIAMGDSAEAATYLADQLFRLPGDTPLEVNDGGTIDAASISVDELWSKIARLPPNTNVRVTGLTQEAMDRLNSLGYKVTTLPNGTVYVSTSGVGTVESEINSAARDRNSTIWVTSRSLGIDNSNVPKFADGGMRSYNGMQSFANGGFPTGIYAGGTPILKFAEPETRWEAFISGRPGQEQRNIGIALEALRRLGYEPRAFADGGRFDHRAVAAARVSSSSSVMNVTNGLMPGAQLVLEVDGRAFAAVVREQAGPVARAAVSEYDSARGRTFSHGRGR